MTIERPSIVVTGLGAVSPLGVTAPAYVRGLREGRSGVRAIPLNMEGRSRIRSSAAATCPDFDPLAVMSDADRKRLPRLVPMGLAAAREALAMARIDLAPARTDVDVHDRAPGDRARAVDDDDDDPSRRVGLILGTGAGGIDFTLDQAQIGYTADGWTTPESRGGISLWTITNATHGNLAGELSIRLGLRGPSWCVSTGCASSSDAIGMAMETLRSARPGTPDAMVVVGADAHVRWETLAGMELLRVISTRDFSSCPDDAATASRPFDVSRDGFVLAEGAWAVVLERAAFAHDRGARVLAHAAGYGATCDAFHRVRPSPDMRESVRAMRLATMDAGVRTSDVHVVHYHGTGTQMNDALETLAVKAVFGDHAAQIVGHSVKGAIGHPQGACGAAAVVATIGAMAGIDGGPGFLPPTANLHEPDVEQGCDLNYTPRRAVARRGERIALVNCLAFGAKNSALVFELAP